MWLVATYWAGQGKGPLDERPTESATGVHVHLGELESFTNMQAFGVRFG